MSDTKIAQQHTIAAEESESSYGSVSLPKGTRLLRDIPYGDHGQQRFDVYLPRDARDAPVIFMVHGGAWRFGDKASAAVVQNKVARWVPRGFIFVSSNYRLMPEADPLGQARDIARALETAQARATAWGGDPTKFILMGHSAGGHLVALLAASSSSRALGAVLLDSAALNVERIMGERHARFYDRAFGQERSYWRAASPIAALSRSSLPTLAVCSTRRTDSCPQAEAFAAEAMSLGASASVIRQHLSHREINKDLGADGAYTNAVEEFMGSLDPSVMRGLKGKL